MITHFVYLLEQYCACDSLDEINSVNSVFYLQNNQSSKLSSDFSWKELKFGVFWKCVRTLMIAVVRSE